MFTVKQFLKESSRAPLYHFSHSIWLESILRFGAISQTEYGETGLGSLGITGLKNGPVSFTRNPKYKVQGTNDVKFTFDQEKLKQRGYKIRPRVDFNLDSTAPKGQKQRHLRVEAEEVIDGPVYLRNGLVKIEVTKEAYEKLVNSLNKFREYAKTSKPYEALAKKQEYVLKSINGFF